MESPGLEKIAENLPFLFTSISTGGFFEVSVTDPFTT
jgi:hypothetical protein